MKQNFGTIIGMALLAVLLNSSAHASGEIDGQFTGKVTCQNGKKKAEFKSMMTLQMSYYASEDIKHRIDELTWPSSGNALTFDDREKEKITLQHALKMLRDLDCDATPPDQQLAPEEPQPLPPSLSPSGDTHH